MKAARPAWRMSLPLLAALASACAAMHVPPPASAPQITHAPVITEGVSVEGSWPGSAWWRSYGDADLDALIQTAIGSGPDLAGAQARIRQAEEQARAIAATLGVTASASASFTRQRLSENGLIPPEFLGFKWYDQSDLGLSLQYQFDWWGKQRASIEAAIDRARALDAEREAAINALAASVAVTYFGWQADSARITLQEQAVALQESTLALTQRRIEAGLEPRDRAIEARSDLAARREALALLQGSRQLRRITLAALAGVDGAALPALAAHPLPAAGTTLPADVGTNLLARRPDIAASRWRVEAALRDTDVARASFYPDISINALAALSSVEVTKLLDPASAAPRLGIALDLPLFEADLRRARHGAAMADLDQAIAAYEASIIRAAREAGTAAATLQQAAAQRVQREAQLRFADELALRAQARAAGGLTPRGPQLAAELDAVAQRDQLVQLDLAALLADVQLRQALGGDAAPRTPTP